MMWYWDSGMHWWGWLLGFLGMAVFWGLIIWAVWYVVVNMSRRPHDPYQPREELSDPKRILDGRLARGEIDTEEYRHLLAVMRGQPSSGSGGTPPVGTRGQ